MQCLEALKAPMPQLPTIMVSGEATLPVVQEALSKKGGGYCQALQRRKSIGHDSTRLRQAGSLIRRPASGFGESSTGFG